MSMSGRGGRQNHTYNQSNDNNRQAQLATAYEELGKELGSDRLTIVGGYTLGRVIGEGTYGSVHIATHRLTGTRCAIKKIPKTNAAHLTREIHHHRRLHHPSIVHLHEVLATESHIWLVTELCSGGELFDYLVERGRMLEGEARRLFGELTVAVGWMHREGVVHRDLKLENVLLDGELKIKLGDLGFAREWQRGRLMETFCGTTGYASPEMLAGRKYLGVETDVWSLGIILYILLCGGLPFDDDDENVMKDLISKGEYEEPDWLSEDARTLIRGMLQHEPSKRLSIEEILTHPWFKLTLYDNIHDSTPHLDKPPHTSSPLASEPHSSDTFLKPEDTSSPTHLLPRHSYPALSPLSREPNNAVVKAESEASETSFDFHDSESGRPDSGLTTPTTAEEDDVGLVKQHSGEFSQTEKTLELLHQNGSQSTIRRPGVDSPGSGTLSGKTKVAKASDLEGQVEEDEEASEAVDLSGSLPVSDDHALHLPVALHSRTPSRTKRRSVSSTMSLERRHSYQNSSKDYHTYPPEDYLSQLSAKSPEPFSTPSEKSLLQQLSDLGFDTGQLVHSVSSDACDASAATWWILRQKQIERGETDEVVQAREASAMRRRERAAAYARDERRKAKATKEALKQDGREDNKESLVTFSESPMAIPPPNPSFTFVDLDLGAPVSSSSKKAGDPPSPSKLTSRLFTASPEKTTQDRLPSPSGADRGSALPSVSPTPETKGLPTTTSTPREQPMIVPLNRDGTLSKPAPQTPPRERRPELKSSPTDPGKGDRNPKARSPSFSMLQRATSAFVGSGKKEDRDKGLAPTPTDIERSAVTPEDKEDKRGHSPSKLHKAPPKAKMGKNENDTNLLHIPLPTSATNTPSSIASRSPEVFNTPHRNPMDLASTSQGSPPKTSHISPAVSSEMNAEAGPGPTSEAISLNESVSKAAKGNKKDSLWTTFRYLFNEDKRRRKRDRAGLPFDTAFAAAGKEVKVSPAIVLSRGIGGRHPHATRLAATPVSGSRRASLDMTRPVYSRRSSSVNSRRSSVTSVHLPADFANNLQRVYSHGSAGQIPNREINPAPALNRRTSERSNGSHTPTSDREYGSSRPSSSQSLSLAHQNSHQPPSSRRSSGTGTGYNGAFIRSPSVQSDASVSGRFKQPTPSSPLHNYHRRATSGSASTRVRHIKVIHETHILRSSSAASSIRSNNSSRASSPERRRDNHDSDYDTGQEDIVSIRNRRRSSDISSLASYSSHSTYHPSHHYHLAQQIHRTRSPLSHGLQASHHHRKSASPSGSNLKPKQPLRDVFQHKDDDWISEDEEGGSLKPKFAGGLGQSSSSSSGRGSGKHPALGPLSLSAGQWVGGNRVAAAQHPSMMMAGGGAGGVAGGGGGKRGGKGRSHRKGRSGRSSDEEDGGGGGVNTGYAFGGGGGGGGGVGLGVGIPIFGQNLGASSSKSGNGSNISSSNNNSNINGNGNGNNKQGDEKMMMMNSGGSGGNEGRGRRAGLTSARAVVPGIVEEEEEEEEE